MGCDLGAKFGQALGRRVSGEVGGISLHDLGGTAGPGFAREEIGCGDAAREQRAEGRLTGVRGDRNGSDLLATPGEGTGSGRGRSRWGGGGVRQVGRDKRAAARAGTNVAFRGQPFIGKDDGLAGHSQFVGEGPCGRQAGTGWQGAGQDALAELIEYRLLSILVWCEHESRPLYAGPIGP
jgi:hypothetical protein